MDKHYSGSGTNFTANFDSDSDGFTYADDVFLETTEAAYADGAVDGDGGSDGSGALAVTLGGVDNADITGMSGGWETTFTVEKDGQATLTFSFDLTISDRYEADEFSQVLIALDGKTFGTGGNDYVARLAGGSDVTTTGWQTVTLELGDLSAGTHTLLLGGFNNKKTTATESTVVRFDDVAVEVAHESEPDSEPGPTPEPNIVLAADFDSGSAGFTYVDDAFRGTSEAAYADGAVDVDGGSDGSGALAVTLGGVDNADITGMSGGWETSFTIDQDGPVTLTFRYDLTISERYEPDEFTQVLVAIDGETFGTGGNDYVAQLAGGSDVTSTGWQTVTLELGDLGAGTHTLRLGGFNNKKTTATESAVVRFDDVSVEAAATTGADTTVLAADFDSGSAGFTYVDDAFRGTSEADYADGAYDADGGSDGSGVLALTLGGVDDADITTGMSGGWETTFSVEQSSSVTLTFRYDLSISAKYEPDEITQVLVAVDGNTVGTNGTNYIAELAGQSGTTSTGWQTVTLELGELGPGTHTLRLGGFNNKKTTETESAVIRFDDVSVEAAPTTDTGPTVLLAAEFNGGPGAFTYVDDAFAGTSEAAYADGFHDADGGADGSGALAVTLGGVDNADINGMSGAWQATFSLDQSGPVTLTFSYELSISRQYDQGETTQVLVAVDGKTVGLDGNSYIAELEGKSGTTSTGWQTVTLELGELGPGAHTLSLGGFNNQKTTANESAVIRFDDIKVEAATAEEPNVLPIANGDDAEVHANGSIVIDVVANDTDADSDPLTITEIETSGTKGAAAIVDGKIAYDASGAFDALGAGETANDTFSYTISDGQGGTDTATVTVTVTGENDLPVEARNDAITLTAGDARQITSAELSFNDVDNSADEITFVITDAPDNGHIELSGAPGEAVTSFTQADVDAGHVIYVHDGGLTETDGFVFDVEDGAGGAVRGQQFDVVVTPVDLALGNSDFNTDTGDFVYIDDAFRGTSAPAYADGVLKSNGGPDDSGIVELTLGGVDNNDITGISGGWETTFSLQQDSGIKVIFSYELGITGAYEDDEFAQVLVSIDGILQGLNGNDYVDQLTGGEPDAKSQTTGWHTVTVDFGVLSAGEHTVRLGGYNNKKTTASESAVIRFDNVRIDDPIPEVDNATPSAVADAVTTSEDDATVIDVLANDSDPDQDVLSIIGLNTAETLGTVTTDGSTVLYDPSGAFDYLAPGETATDTFVYTIDDGYGAVDSNVVTVTVTGVGEVSTTLTAGFDGGVDGFTYVDDAFNGTANPSYADGMHADGALHIELGGVDDADVYGMSGAWQKSFTLDGPANVSLSLDYILSHSSGYEAGEYTDLIVQINGQTVGGDEFLVRIEGGDATTGPTSASLDLGVLSGGEHTLSIGGFNNVKTHGDESADIAIDSVEITADATAEWVEPADSGSGSGGNGNGNPPPPPPSGNAFYVSTLGNDSWSGRLAEPNADGTDGPFATLERARDAMRSDGEIDTTYLREGTYHLNSTLELTSSDSGISFLNYPGENPIVSGGETITGFVHEGNGVYSADVDTPTGMHLRIGDDVQKVAQTGDYDPSDPYESGWLFAEATSSGAKMDAFEMRRGDVDPFTLSDQIKIEVVNPWRWVSNMMDVDKIDFGSGRVDLSDNARYSLTDGSTYRFLNSADWIQDDGEFGWRASDGRLVVKTDDPSSLLQDGAVAGRLDTIIQLSHADNVTISGLTISDGTMDGHAVRLDNSDGVQITGNTILQAGNGVSMYNSSHNYISGNEISGMGSNGIGIRSGSGSSDSNQIVGNHIHDIGEFQINGVGVTITGGSGTLVSHNLMTDMTRHAVNIGNRYNYDTVVEYNEMLRTNQAGDDTGAIYQNGRKDIQSGSIFRYNYIDDAGGVETTSDFTWNHDAPGYGIYLDDQTNDVDVYGNFIKGTNSGSVMVHGGDNNEIYNNVMILSDEREEGIHLQWGMGGETGYLKNNTITGNIFYAEEQVQDYWYTWKPGSFDWDNNLLYNIAKTYGSADRNSINADPQFVDADGGDYRLKSGSPAYDLGFVDLPWDEMGLAGFRPSESNSDEWPIWDALMS